MTHWLDELVGCMICNWEPDDCTCGKPKTIEDHPDLAYTIGEMYWVYFEGGD